MLPGAAIQAVVLRHPLPIFHEVRAGSRTICVQGRDSKVAFLDQRLYSWPAFLPSPTKEAITRTLPLV